jgi:hypothetical protein
MSMLNVLTNIAALILSGAFCAIAVAADNIKTPAEQGKRCGSCAFAEPHIDLLSHKRRCMEGYGIKSLGSLACGVFKQRELKNIPTRGFCVSADLEQINAESYKYTNDPKEFEPPDIDVEGGA